MYWIYFTGTVNGEWIEAANMKSAKWIFAIENNLSSIGYISGRKKRRREEVECEMCRK